MRAIVMTIPALPAFSCLPGEIHEERERARASEFNRLSGD